jgi:hypothetical protein
MDIDIKQQIKEILLKENLTMTDLVSKLNARKPTEENNTTVASLNNKLTRGTIKYSEILEIFDVLDYDVSLHKRYNTGDQSSKGEFFTPKSLLGALAGFTVGGIGGSIIGGALGNTLDSKTQSESITNLKENKIVADMKLLTWEQMQLRFDLEEQFQDILELVINSIIENANLEGFPDKIKSEIILYQNSNLAIGFRLQNVYRGLYIIVAQQIKSHELIDYLSDVRKMYADGGTLKLDNNTIREFIEKADYLINTVFKKD